MSLQVVKLEARTSGTDILFPLGTGDGGIDYTGTWKFYGNLAYSNKTISDWDDYRSMEAAFKKDGIAIVHRDGWGYVGSENLNGSMVYWMSGWPCLSYMKATEYRMLWSVIIDELTDDDYAENASFTTFHNVVELTYPSTSSNKGKKYYGPDTNTAFTATCKKVYKYHRNCTAGAGGTVSAASGNVFVNGGNTYIVSGNATYTATPSAGYSFSHWTMNGATTSGNSYCTVNGNTISINDTATSDLNFQAVFVASYSVTFDPNGGNGEMAPQEFNVGESKALSYNQFWRTGYTFGSWAQNANGTGRTFNDGQSVSNLTTTAGGIYRLYAQWMPNTYTVTFNGAGATTQGTLSVSVQYGMIVPSITPPSRTGYTFAGYFSQMEGRGTKYYDNSGTGVANYDIDGNTMLYAHWERNKYSVSFTNEKPDVCTLTARCSNPALSASESGGVLSFLAVEGSTYRITATYASKFLADKYPLAAFVYGGTSYQASKMSDTEYSLDYVASVSAPRAFTTSFLTTPQYSITTVVSCRLGVPPTVTIVPARDSADGWFKQDVEIEFSIGENPYVEFDTWSAAMNGTVYDSYHATDPDPMKFFLQGNTDLSVAFRVKTCEATVAVDSASQAAGAGTASVFVDQYTPGVTHYGDVATYVASPSTGFTFYGWFDRSGNPAPDSTVDGVAYTHTDATYRAELLGDTHYVAKFAARVRLEVGRASGSSATGVVFVDGEGGTPAYEKNVVLGGMCQIEAQTSDYFGGWFLGPDPSFASDIPLQYEQVDSMVVTGNVTLVALLMDEESFNYVALYNYDARDGHEVFDETLGAWSVSSPNGLVEITRSQYEEAMTPIHGSVYSAPSNGRFFRVSGIRKLSLATSATGALGLSFVRKFYFNEMDEPLQEYATNRFDVVINDNFAFVANWGEPATRTVRGLFANGSSVGLGSLSLDGVEPAEDGSVEGSFVQSSLVTVSAIPRNGYRFVGWYYTADHVGEPASTDKDYTFRVQADTTLYAVFEQDRNAIYEWEGSLNPKLASWRSKVFQASKPFNPSVVRVDSVRYPVTVDVDVFTAPNDAPVRHSQIVIRSAKSKRLPLLRPERYVQVAVSGYGRIDGVVVSTSMEGANT